MKSYNLDKLVKVEVYKERIDDFYSFKKEIKFLGIVIRDEGFYSILHDYQKECPENHVCINGKVYLKPRIYLTFVNEYTEMYFETYDEALKFHSEIVQKRHNWIIDGRLSIYKH